MLITMFDIYVVIYAILMIISIYVSKCLKINYKKIEKQIKYNIDLCFYNLIRTIAHELNNLFGIYSNVIMIVKKCLYITMSICFYLFYFTNPTWQTSMINKYLIMVILPISMEIYLLINIK